MTTTLDRVRSKYAPLVGCDPDKIGVKAVVSPIRYSEAGGRPLITAVANTASVDLQDEVVVPAGAKRDDRNAVFYFSDARSIYYNHDYSQVPIGALRNMALRADGWHCQFSVHGKTALSADLLAMFALGEDNPVRGTSIGFQRIEAGDPTDEEVALYGDHSYITRSWMWLELSVTPMPCNPDAMIEGVSLPSDDAIRQIETLARKGIITKSTARIMGVPAPKKYLTVPRVLTVG